MIPEAFLNANTLVSALSVRCVLRDFAIAVLGLPISFILCFYLDLNLRLTLPLVTFVVTPVIPIGIALGLSFIIGVTVRLTLVEHSDHPVQRALVIGGLVAVLLSGIALALGHAPVQSAAALASISFVPGTLAVLSNTRPQ